MAKRLTSAALLVVALLVAGGIVFGTPLIERPAVHLLTEVAG